MKIKDIDDWDHFKGDFKGKAADKTVSPQTKALQSVQAEINRLHAQIQANMLGLSVPKITTAPNKNTGINSGGALVAYQGQKRRGYTSYKLQQDLYLDSLGYALAVPGIFGGLQGLSPKHAIIDECMPAMTTKEYEQSVCEHDPIDVGFAKVKMACRKCDKDL